MRCAIVTVVAWLAGCDVVFELEKHGGDGSCPHGLFGRSAGEDAVPRGLLDVCLTAAPQAMFDGTLTINTTVVESCTLVVAQSDGTEVCVIAANRIALETTTTISGTRPIVFVATDTIEVRGSLSVASTRIGGLGAGAQPSTCVATLNGKPGPPASGAGAGGSFKTRGGSGGRGAGTVLGGSAALEGAPLAFVRGGCRGGSGGTSGPRGGGASGGGGGAMYFVAGSSISVRSTARLNASGAGGGGGRVGASGTSGGSGGGGGGSGGLIGFDAPMVMIEPGAQLVANGGGGGGGGGPETVNRNGDDGSDVDLASTFPFVAASGVNSTPGGTGAAGTTDAASGTDGASLAGGGGGGGGHGHIVVYARSATITGAIASPTIANP